MSENTVCTEFELSDESLFIIGNSDTHFEWITDYNNIYTENMFPMLYILYSSCLHHVLSLL